jgi:peptidoglycan/xylan/chitin deacetylase (PgdA/CDA1 family)
MIRLKGVVRHLLAESVYRTGFFALRMRQMFRGHTLALMYHRIIPRSAGGAFLQPGLYVEPDTFERHLRFLKKHFELLPSSTLCSGNAAAAARVSGRPACVVTFDDGWADFYTNAFPLILKYQVPVTVFLPTGFIGTARRFWTERLGQLCVTAERRGAFATLQGFVRQRFPSLECAPVTAAAFKEWLIDSLKAYRIEDIELFLGQLEAKFPDDAFVAGRDFLTWEEIKEMQSSGLVTFGSHTENHLLLTTLSEEEICYELTASKHALLAHHLCTVSDLSFCFPNGNYNGVTISELDKAGYVYAFTTQCGWNAIAPKHFELKRVGVHQDIAITEALLAYRILSAHSK